MKKPKFFKHGPREPENPRVQGVDAPHSRTHPDTGTAHTHETKHKHESHARKSQTAISPLTVDALQA